MTRRRWLIGGVVASGAAGMLIASRRTQPRAPDVGWFPSDNASKPKVRITRRSLYVPARDGVRLALDIYLPQDLSGDARLPTILIQTRYFRRGIAVQAARPIESFIDVRLPGIRRFIAGGYAVVVADARGSGASFGCRTAEWDSHETADGADIADWIVKQSWSNGIVVATGGSYEGSTAEHLLRNRHRAVKAAVLRCALWDGFVDIVAPGGVRSEWFLSTWAGMNRAKDANTQRAFMLANGAGRMKWLSFLDAGIAPVDDDNDGSLLQSALTDHQANYDLIESLRDVEFRDDPRSDGTTTLDDFSPCTHLEEIRASGAAVYSWSSWFDGAYPEAAVKRWLALRDVGARLILGPWDHTNKQLPDPTTEARTPAFDMLGEVLRFFDHHGGGRPNRIGDEPPVWYYTMGSGWSSSKTWPPEGFTQTDFFFGPKGSLQREPSGNDEEIDRYQVDPTATTGNATRWTALLNIWGRKIGYPDRVVQDRKLLVYDTDPLARATQVTGHPILTLHIASTAADGAFHAYLEELLPDGRVRYVTEGIFRAIHRRVGSNPPNWHPPVPYHTFRRTDAMPLVPDEPAEISFALQPVSYVFGRGSRIRIALAGADDGNFVAIPEAPPRWTVYRSRARSSRITLPIAER